MDARIQLLHENPCEAITREWGRDPKVFDLFLVDTLSIVDSKPRDGKNSVKTIMRHAPTLCQRVQGYGLWAQIHRAIGELDTADTAIKDAFFLGEECSECVADLHRRRAVIRRNSAVLRGSHDLAHAIEDADEAVQRYLELGHPGHSIDRNGLASSYNVRAVIRFYMNDFKAAVVDEREALAALDPRVSPVLYRIVITNLAMVLQATGKHSDLLEAEKYLKKANLLFRGVEAESQERSKLQWVTSQVRYQLGKGQPCDLREPMERALNFFLSEGMIPEAVAIAADLMKMKLARRHWGREEPRVFVREILKTLRERLPRLPPEELKKPLYVGINKALQGVRSAVDASDFYGHEKLKAAITGLRAACGPDPIVCLVTWPAR